MTNASQSHSLTKARPQHAELVSTPESGPAAEFDRVRDQFLDEWQRDAHGNAAPSWCWSSRGRLAVAGSLWSGGDSQVDRVLLTLSRKRR
jgi:hypothetical protein